MEINKKKISLLIEDDSDDAYFEFHHYLLPSSLRLELKKAWDWNKKKEICNLEKDSTDERSYLYSIRSTKFGMAVMLENEYGICRLSFTKDIESELSRWKEEDGIEKIEMGSLENGNNAWKYMEGKNNMGLNISLQLVGTDFQIRVWNQLLQIPYGCLTSYGQISERLQLNKGSRAVGTAIGQNKIAYFIPCHRVVNNNGKIGKFRWGSVLKAMMIGAELYRKNLKNRTFL